MIVYNNKHTQETDLKGEGFIYKKHGDSNLELSLYVLNPNRTFYLSPPKVEGSIKTYHLIKGHVVLSTSGENIGPNDVIVLKYGDEHLNVEPSVETHFYVTNFGDRNFNQVSHKIDTILEIMRTIQNKDDYTDLHCDRVAALARIMAKELKLTDENSYLLVSAARFHDLGKSIIPDHILNKTSQLSEEEYQIMKTHVIETKALLPDHINALISKISSEHHERLDGSGYPLGLKKEEISYEGQILAVLDTYDAMTSNRVYKKGKTPSEAFEELYELESKYNRNIVSSLEAALIKYPELANH